jgi:threonine synthase
MLAVRYDLPRVASSVTRNALRERAPGMYRFRELTPLDDGEQPMTLGEGGTPLLELPRLAAHFGIRKLWGRTKARIRPGRSRRAASAWRSRARGRSAPGASSSRRPATPAARRPVYAARCGLPCVVIVPRGTPPAAVAEAQIAGAHVFTIEGSIATAGRVVAKVAPLLGWFDLSTLKEPYRLEGKKTMGLELAEQLDWRMPDVLLYPTAAAPGSWAFPRATRSSARWAGCRAHCRASSPSRPTAARRGEGVRFGCETTTAWENPTTHAAGLRVPSPFAGRQMLRILRETRGGAVAVSEKEIQDAQRLVARTEGIWTAPESAALVAALARLKDGGVVARDAEVMLILTGAGLKYAPPPLAPPTDLAGSEEEVLAQVRRAVGA